jgi:hypothetical protein
MMMKRQLVGILFVLLIVSLPAQPIDTVKIAAVGDIMLGTSYPDSSFLPKNGSFRLFRPLHKQLMDADITFGNLEGVLTDDLSQVKECFTEGRCYYFAMPTVFTQSLQKAGFDILSLANNHINDFGYIGRKSTKRSLHKHSIRHAGLSEKPAEIFTQNGIKYGFCAFAPNAGTLSIKDLKKAEKVVQYLDSLCDIVIVSFHAGGEGVEYQHVTRQTEFYIGENRGNVYEFAHRIIDAGADVLLGHGPHVPRAVEVYKGRFIAYSMGNFLTYSRVSVAGKCGLAPLFHIYTDKAGRLLEAQIIPTYQLKYQAPKYDPQNRVIKIIQELTAIDFPEMKNVIRIEDNGRIVNLQRK